MIALYVLGGLVLLMMIIGVSLHNGIIEAMNGAKRAWSDVIAYERQKIKVLPKLEEMARDYKEYESALQNSITELRSAIGKLHPEAINAGDLTAVEKQSASFLRGVQIAVEQYPDLKASGIVSGLMKEFTELQANITAAIAIFNKNTEHFNNAILTFPGSWINGRYTKLEVMQPFTETEAAQSFEYKPF